MSAVETVIVNLSWTYGVMVDGRTVYYGPGEVPVPVDVARRMGWQDVSTAGSEEIPTFPPVEQTDYPAAEVADSAGVKHLTDALIADGFRFATHITQATEAELTAVPGIGPATARKLQAAAETLLTGD